MRACGAVHPERGVICQEIDEHPVHLVSLPAYPPEYVTWVNDTYVSPQDAREQAAQQVRDARQVAKDGAAATSAVAQRLARAEDPGTAKEAAEAYVAAQAHTTRLGKVAKHLIDNVGIWVDAVTFTHTDVGGFAGTRRLRELREEYGWNIETRRKPGSAVAWQHRLVELPPTE